MKKIVIEIETPMPDDFDLDDEVSELFNLEIDIKRKFEEITGYSILNIYTKIEDYLNEQRGKYSGVMPF